MWRSAFRRLARGRFLTLESEIKDAVSGPEKLSRQRDMKNPHRCHFGPSSVVLQENIRRRCLEELARDDNSSSEKETAEATARPVTPLVVSKNDDDASFDLTGHLARCLAANDSPNSMFNVAFKSGEEDKDLERVGIEVREEEGEKGNDEKSQSTLVTHLNLNHCQQLTSRTYFREAQWKFVYQDLLRSRRKFWKRYLFNPWSLQLEQEDATSDQPKAKILCTFEDQKYQLARPLLLETLDMLPTLSSSSSSPSSQPLKVVETTTNLSNGTLALLLDSVRKRMLMDSTRIALHSDLTPHQVSFVLSPNSPSARLQDLRRLLTLLAEAENIAVLNEADDFDKADDFGLPFLVVMSEDTLQDGVVHLRDRETCWFEQIHIAHVTNRLVQIFHKRSLPEDTWQSVKREFSKSDEKQEEKQEKKKATRKRKKKEEEEA